MYQTILAKMRRDFCPPDNVEMGCSAMSAVTPKRARYDRSASSSSSAKTGGHRGCEHNRKKQTHGRPAAKEARTPGFQAPQPARARVCVQKGRTRVDRLEELERRLIEVQLVDKVLLKARKVELVAPEQVPGLRF